MCYTLAISTSFCGDHVVWVTRFPLVLFFSFSQSGLDGILEDCVVVFVFFIFLHKSKLLNDVITH